MGKSIKIPEHLHQYKRVILGGRRVVRREDGKRYIEKCSGYEIFKCMFPGCPHHVPTELVIGRKGACWICGEELTISLENIKLNKPTHVWCRKIRERLA